MQEFEELLLQIVSESAHTSCSGRDCHFSGKYDTGGINCGGKEKNIFQQMATGDVPCCHFQFSENNYVVSLKNQVARTKVWIS